MSDEIRAAYAAATGADRPEDAAAELAGRLLDMARAGDAEQLIPYLDAGAPIDLEDEAGNTLTMLAAYHGRADLVRVLAERGADVDRLNARGQSPLAGAVFKGEQPVVAALLEHDADPAAGSPSALATAEMFDRSDLLPPG